MIAGRQQIEIATTRSKSLGDAPHGTVVSEEREKRQVQQKPEALHQPVEMRHEICEGLICLAVAQITKTEVL